MTKYCKDCKYHYGPYCNNHKAFNEVDLVTEEKTQRYKYATSQRDFNFLEKYFFKACGSVGRWFEPKDKP
jgi:hypothetical protein